MMSRSTRSRLAISAAMVSLSANRSSSSTARASFSLMIGMALSRCSAAIVLARDLAGDARDHLGVELPVPVGEHRRAHLHDQAADGLDQLLSNRRAGHALNLKSQISNHQFGISDLRFEIIFVRWSQLQQ